MLLTTVDFNKYKIKINQHLSSNFETYSELENYLQEELGVSIGKCITDIIRAINILNNLDRDENIRDATEVELILMANITQNKEKLLKYKNEDNVSRYLSTLTLKKLTLLEKLSDVFSDIVVISLTIPEYKLKPERIQSKRQLNDKQILIPKIWLGIIVIFAVVASIYTIISLKTKQSKNQTYLNNVTDTIKIPLSEKNSSLQVALKKENNTTTKDTCENNKTSK